MDRVSYTGIYDEDCPFDVTSEFVGTYPWWTNAYLDNDANREEIDGVLRSFREEDDSYDLQTKRDRGTSWLSVFTTVASCTNRTMKVRFFEKDDKVVTLSFD